MDFFSLVQEADEYLYRLINGQWVAHWLDGIMKLLRNPLFWAPLYFFLLIWFFKRKREYVVLILLLSILCFALTDFTSAKILKPYLARLRPCYVPELGWRSIVGCGGQYGLPSSHASNHFGLAAFWFILVRGLFKRNWYWLWIWAAMIGYAQVYVGVHYPSDILAGAALGIILGTVCSGLFYFIDFSFIRKKKMAIFIKRPEVS